MKDSICNKINTNLINKIKKCFLLSLSVFLILPLYVSTVNAEDKFGGYARGYSDWSTIPTGNQGEVSAIQYGRLLPKEWSEWSTSNWSGQTKPTEPTEPNTWYIEQASKDSNYKNYHFESKKDFGSEERLDKKYNGEKHFSSAGSRTLTIDLGERKHIKHVMIDIDYYHEGDDDSYVSPAMNVYADGTWIAGQGEKKCGSDGKSGEWAGMENLSKDVNVWGRTITIEVSSATSRGQTDGWFHASSVKTELIKYRHVIVWDDPKPEDWRFDDPYPLKDGDGSQIPVERIVYSYPYPPVLGLKTNYYFVKRPTSIETVMGNAIATDIVDGVITPTIHFDKIIYQSGETVTDRTAMLNTSKEQDFELYCSVVNSNGIPATAHKTYHIYDLVTPGLTDPETVNPEEYVNVDIYDRFISEKYKDTLQGNSLWETDSNYKNLLNDVLSRETGEEYDID